MQIQLTIPLLHCQDINPTFSRPQSPFAFCGILLVADALVDLIIVTKLPQINEVLAYATARTAGSDSSSGTNTNADTTVPRALDTSAARAGALYSEIWTLLAASRFCLFFAVSFFIYHSKPGAWGVSDAGPPSDAVPSGLDQLKNRVIFTYGFMEMLFWFWVRRHSPLPFVHTCLSDQVPTILSYDRSS